MTLFWTILYTGLMNLATSRFGEKWVGKWSLDGREPCWVLYISCLVVSHSDKSVELLLELSGQEGELFTNYQQQWVLPYIPVIFSWTWSYHFTCLNWEESWRYTYPINKQKFDALPFQTTFAAFITWDFLYVCTMKVKSSNAWCETLIVRKYSPKTWCLREISALNLNSRGVLHLEPENSPEDCILSCALHIFTFIIIQSCFRYAFLIQTSILGKIFGR